MNTVPTVKHGGSSIMFLGYFAVSGTITLHRVDGIMKEENFSNLFHIYLENYKEMGVAQDFCIVPYLKSSSHMRLYECFILQRFHNLLSSHFILLKFHYAVMHSGMFTQVYAKHSCTVCNYRSTRKECGLP